MIRFTLRYLLFCHIKSTILVDNMFDLSFFMIEVFLWSLACNGVLVANYNQWWVIAVVLIEVLQCAIG